MADPRKMTPEELVLFLLAAEAAVAGGKVAGFLAAQNTSISDALTDMAAELSADNTDFMNTEEAFNSARAARSATFESALALISDLKLGMHSVNSDAETFTIVGFDAPDTTRSQVMPQKHTDLSGTGYSNGTNVLRWRCANRPGSVIYMLEAKIGDTAGYVPVGATRSKSFRHLGCTPGQFYQYHVRSEAARGSVSEWSDPAVVYGV